MGHFRWHELVSVLDLGGCSLVRLTLHGLEIDCIGGDEVGSDEDVSPRFWVGGLGVWVQVTWIGTLHSAVIMQTLGISQCGGCGFLTACSQ